MAYKKIKIGNGLLCGLYFLHVPKSSVHVQQGFNGIIVFLIIMKNLKTIKRLCYETKFPVGKPNLVNSKHINGTLGVMESLVNVKYPNFHTILQFWETFLLRKQNGQKCLIFQTFRHLKTCVVYGYPLIAINNYNYWFSNMRILRYVFNTFPRNG